MNKENKEKVKNNICPTCGRPTYKKSKYCIFHANAEEKTEEEFIKKLRKHIKNIKEKGEKYNFEKFIFVGNTDFKEDLNVTTFKSARFYGATFKGYAGFYGTIFRGLTHFNDTTFEGLADFNGTIFRGLTRFNGATFEEYADFNGATFKREANFYSATFKREANFQKATFEREASFQEAFLPPGKIFSLKVKKGGSISFENTYLEGVLLKLTIDKDVLINFNEAKLINTKIEKRDIIGHLLHEQNKEFSQAKEVYKLLKNNFRSIGNYQEEKWAFLKEKEMERESNSYWVFKKENENKIF